MRFRRRDGDADLTPGLLVGFLESKVRHHARHQPLQVAHDAFQQCSGQPVDSGAGNQSQAQQRAAGELDQEGFEGAHLGFVVAHRVITAEAGNACGGVDGLLQGTRLVDQTTILGIAPSKRSILS